MKYSSYFSSNYFFFKCSVLFFVSMFLVAQANADWSDDYVGELTKHLSAFESAMPDTPLSPEKLLPLDAKNRWYYSFDSEFDEAEQNNNIEARLGALESLGDFCIRPLIFDSGRTELLLINHNDRIVLYGFRSNLNNKPVEFLFQNGASATTDSGILLVASSDKHVQASQQGRFPVVINGTEVQVEWFASDKQINSIGFSNANLDGLIAGQPSVVPDGEKVLSSFRLDLGCAASCFAARFFFEFTPGVGLSLFRIVGDHPELGGQVDYQYQLQESPDDAFDLTQSSNQNGYFSCSLEDTNDVSLSQGGLLIWFNISLLFVVLLRILSSLKSIDEQIL